MTTSYKIPFLLAVGLSTALVAGPSHAVTQRNAFAQVFNESSRVIDWVRVEHKYSTNYREQRTWRNIKRRALSGNRLRVKYNTGFGTTGKDWWRVSWRLKGSNKVCTTNPSNVPSNGFKQHILRAPDINKRVIITVYNRRLSIKSPSGTSWTTFKCKEQGSAPSRPRNAEKQCYNMVQGKVSWNKAGNKGWGANNVKKLCKRTRNPSRTIRCFRRQIKKHNNWQRAIQACAGKF